MVLAVVLIVSFMKFIHLKYYKIYECKICQRFILSSLQKVQTSGDIENILTLYELKQREILFFILVIKWKYQMFDRVTEKDILISLWVNLNKQSAHNLRYRDSMR